VNDYETVTVNVRDKEIVIVHDAVVFDVHHTAIANDCETLAPDKATVISPDEVSGRDTESDHEMGSVLCMVKAVGAWGNDCAFVCHDYHILWDVGDVDLDTATTKIK